LSYGEENEYWNFPKEASDKNMTQMGMFQKIVDTVAEVAITSGKT
jgi:hypothetical protein